MKMIVFLFWLSVIDLQSSIQINKASMFNQLCT